MLLALLGVLFFVQGVATEIPITSAGGAATVTVDATQYTINADLRWKITNIQLCPGGNPIVMLRWLTVGTEEVADFLVVYDGNSTGSRILQQVSGTAVPNPINSTSPSLYVTFSSNADKTPADQGFSFHYDFACGPKIDINANCRAASSPLVLNATITRGLLEYEDSQGTYQDCYWVISNEMSNCSDPYIEIEFKNFSALFPYDYLELFDGNTTNSSNQIGRYQGSKVYYGPGFQRSVGKQILIVFHNEYAHTSTDWTGFIATYTAKCDEKPGPNCPTRDAPRVFNTTDYMVFSPVHYRPDSGCYFLFSNMNTTCKNPVVLMIFPVFRTTELYDTVTLWNGKVPGIEGNELGKWSGSAADAVPLGFQRSTSPDVLLEFHSGSIFTNDWNRGFTVQFAFPCGEELPPPQPDTCPPYFDRMPAPQGPQTLDFTSSSYRNNLDCGWVFLNNQSQCSGPNNTAVTQIEFTNFVTEPNFDFLNIYDGPVYRTGSSLAYDDRFLIGSWSGSAGWEIPTVVRSTRPSIMVTFHSDGTVSDLDDDGTHEDGFTMKVSNVCSQDPLPTTVYYDCRNDNGNVYARFWTNDTLQNPRVTFGHHYLPFNLGYPLIIEQAFTNPEPQSMLSSRGENGVTAEVVVGYDSVVAGNWTCCGVLQNSSAYYKGKILICQRGDCLFVDKVRLAQQYQVAGVIIVDTTESGVRMGSTVPVNNITVPSVSTVASLGTLLLNVTRRAPLYVSLRSYVCANGTYSPTTTYVYTDSPTPADDPDNPPYFPPSPDMSPSSPRSTPTPPSPPTPLAPNTTMFFTLPLPLSGFTDDVKSRFMDSVNNFFLWAPGTATLTQAQPDPDDAGSTVAGVLVDGNSANSAYNKWGSATNTQKLMLSPNVMSISPHQPHARCVAVDCESTSLRVAQWDSHACTCSRFLTGAGSFVEIVLPILLILLLLLLLCCCCPFCPLFGRYKKQQGGHQKVAMDEMQMHDVNMIPRGVKDSEESMRGEGQPFGDTEDPPAERRAWDDVERNRGSALIRPSETDQDPIRIAHPRSDDSDEEEGGRAHVH